MKRLIVCADGTWSEPTQVCPTNVVKLTRRIASSDQEGHRQLVYYHEGIGAGARVWEKLSGGAFGAGIAKGIQDVYLFLANNFEVGDELWLFGFSRGAFTVRSVAGLIRNSGLLRREHADLYRQAYALYRDRGAAAHPNSASAENFRRRYAHEPRIRFIGVWETIGALGIPVTPLRFWSKKRHEFHDVELSGRIDFAFQALAIDEKRKPFAASLWRRDDPKKVPDQILEQVWFPGVHCDVGGGYAETGLCDAALLWMINGAKRAGLSFSALDGVAPSCTAPAHDSMTLGFRLLGDGTRSIGQMNPGGNERLAACTENRRQALAYNPKNLADFLASHTNDLKPRANPSAEPASVDETRRTP